MVDELCLNTAEWEQGEQWAERERCEEWASFRETESAAQIVHWMASFFAAFVMNAKLIYYYRDGSKVATNVSCQFSPSIPYFFIFFQFFAAFNNDSTILAFIAFICHNSVKQNVHYSPIKRQLSNKSRPRLLLINLSILNRWLTNNNDTHCTFIYIRCVIKLHWILCIRCNKLQITNKQNYAKLTVN